MWTPATRKQHIRKTNRYQSDPQSTIGKRLRGHRRLRSRLPIRRIRHAAPASHRSGFMTFETDSKTRRYLTVARPTRSRRLLPNAQAARNIASDVTFECNFVCQGREPSGITLTFACSRTNLLTAKNGPGTTARSLQSGRFCGKKS